MRFREIGYCLQLVLLAAGCAAESADEGVSASEQAQSASGFHVHALRGAPEKWQPIRPIADGPADALSLGTAASASTGNGITYAGGQVMSGTVNVYYIWYGNWAGDTAPSILTEMVQSLGGSPWYGINTTYGDNAGHVVANSVHFGTWTTDNYSRGKTLTGTAVRDIVAAAITSSRLPKDANGVYFVLTSPDVAESSSSGSFCASYCAYHGHASISGVDIKYGFVGNPAQKCPTNCEAQPVTSPNDNPAADAMASTLAHELVEAATDPDVNAWGAGGRENADLCVWSFGVTTLLGNGAKSNIRLGSRNYLIQQNWVNQAGGYCGMHVGNTDVGVVADTVSPAISPCPGKSLVSLHMDDEDSANHDARIGWTGISTAGPDSTLSFCKVSGESFHPLSSGQPYALLKLGRTCPNESVEVARFFDNEDNGNTNTVIRQTEALPNGIVGSGMSMKFCLFTGTGSMDGFPELGLGSYGVLASDTGGRSYATGTLFSDDENDSNGDTMSCGSFCAAASTAISGAHDTTFQFSQVAACGGAADGWPACRGNGCAVCGEMVSGYSNYFRNHPNCTLNNTCDGGHSPCNTNCPAPTSADL